MSHKGHREKLIDGDEQDCLTRWRKVLNHPHNGWKWVKKKYNKRVRQKTKEKIRKNEY